MSAVRLVASRVLRAAVYPRARVAVSPRVVAAPSNVALWRQYSTKKAEESDEAFDARWEAYFQRPDIDDWELKKGLNEIYGHDLVPEPKIVVAMLQAARRLDNIPMALRIIEAVKEKCAGNKEMYKYVMDAVKPTLDELEIPTPEDLGLA